MSKRFSRIGTFSLLLMVTALFIPFPFVVNSAVIKALLDVVHVPLFIVLTLVLFCLQYFWIHWAFRRALLITTGGMVIFAFGSEWLQGIFGRDPSLSDAVNNLFGIGSALALILAVRNRSCYWGAVFVAVLAVGMAVSLSPVRVASTAVTDQRARLPLLGDFEEDWELILWKAQGDVGADETRIRRDDEWAITGTHSLRVDTFGAEWAGVHLLADLSDWSEYTHLKFDLKASGPPQQLGIRVDLRDGRRFSGSIDLDTGENSCSVGFDALRNQNGQSPGASLSNVIRLVLHSGKDGRRETFFLDNIRLE